MGFISMVQKSLQSPQDTTSSLQAPRESPPFSLDKPFPFQTWASLTSTVCKPAHHCLPTHPSFKPMLPTWSGAHTHGLSLGARRALHAWQPLIPFLTGLPRGAYEAN